MSAAVESVPSDDDLSAKIRELVPKVDLNTTGVKSFTKLLSKEFGGVALKSRTPFIKRVLEEVINEMDDSDEEEDGEGDEDDDDEDDDEIGDETDPSRKRKRSAKSGTSGIQAKKKISEKLASLIGQGDEMARTEVVKWLWAYIREHDLQNPEDKREILLDAPMREVFGVDTFGMFSMQKYVSAHIEPFKPVDLTPATDRSKRATRSDRAEPKAKPPKKKKTAQKPGSQPPYQLSDALADVLGCSILPRPQVVSSLWEYIKANDLQNAKDKRQILCDEKLKKVMGKKKVTMFEMNRLITPHLIEKLPRSAYQHEGENEALDESDDEE